MNEHHKNQAFDSVVWLSNKRPIQIMNIRPNYFDPFDYSTGAFRIIDVYRIDKLKTPRDIVAQTIRMITPDYNPYEFVE